ncbi:MAG: hypothetical protein GAK41_00856 [Burkholderia gladioli]|nr:MAG: hypothetical protein GAK41_00856 [Burkholderia gladioli]
MTALSPPALPELPALLDLAAVDPDALPLLARLTDADAAVRRIATFELADLKDSELVPVFVATLAADPAADVRREAALALAAWEQPDAVDALCAALLDADDGVREAAAQSLSELKEPASGATLRRWAERPEPFVVRAVLRGLRELRYADAWQPALAALDSSDAGVRLEAVAVLGWLKDARAVPRLAALGDEAWQVREATATTLGRLRAKAAVAAPEQALDDAYWQVRLRATCALGLIGERASGPKIAALLGHAISNLRKETALALALSELRDPAALDALRAALDDADPEVRKAVRIAIGQIEQSGEAGA